jgi:AcrR family transcriptional regulator
MAVERVVRVDKAGREGGHVVEMQRRRLLGATVEQAYEHGVQSLTVATICERAGLSRRTFYEIFDERESCLYAAFEDAVEQAVRVVNQAVAEGGGAGGAQGTQGPRGTQAARGARRADGWREQTRAGLMAFLCFLDREPGMGRLLVVEALGAGQQTLEARRRGIAQIIAHIDQGRMETRGGHEPPSLTAEGIVGAVFSVVHARMLQRDQQPLVELCGPLMAMIVQPYLGAAAAQKELERPVPAPEQPAVPRLPADPFKGLSLRFTYRTARVLSTIAEVPGASSKRVATASGIVDPGQASRLLTRLQRHGLIQDTGVGPAKGMARAWTLTERGESILQATGHA